MDCSRDFDAPLPAPLDTASATIAAAGLLLLSSLETHRSNTSGARLWSTASIELLRNTADLGLKGWSGVSVLGNGTVNNRAKT